MSSTIQKVINTDNYEFYVTHLSLVNALLKEKLVNKEIEVLASFLALDENITKDDVFNTLARKNVKDKFNLSAGGLSNHLRSLIDKKILYKDEVTNKISIMSFIIPDKRVQFYNFKLINNG
jgi:hypothetical protein